MTTEQWVSEVQELDGTWLELKRGTLRQCLSFNRRFRAEGEKKPEPPPETRVRQAPTPKNVASPRNQTRRRKR